MNKEIIKEVYATFLFVIIPIGFILLGVFLGYNYKPESKLPHTIQTINTDTTRASIDTIRIKQQIIEKHYETKINNYHTLPNNKRVELFSERINR